jgi:hypothetical protein
MQEKFSKEMETMNKNQVNTLEIKAPISQIQITIDSIISRQDKKKERISELWDKD